MAGHNEERLVSLYLSWSLGCAHLVYLDVIPLETKLKGPTASGMYKNKASRAVVSGFRFLHFIGFHSLFLHTSQPWILNITQPGLASSKQRWHKEKNCTVTRLLR
jgi:hypothetical protein